MNKLITFPQKSPTLQRAAVVEKKGVPMITYPAQLFFGIADKYDESQVRGLSAYAASAIAYACMRYRATKIVEAPLWIAEEGENGEEWVKDHPLAELLERPNPDMEMADLLELTQLYMDATGQALWVKTRGRNGRVVSLYPFSRDEFTVSADNTRLFSRFTVVLRNGNRDFAPEDVVYFRNIDPRNPLTGLAPLDAAISQVNIAQSLRDAVRSQLKRAIMPSALFTFEPFADDEDRQRARADIAAYQGALKSGAPMVLEGGKMEQLPWTLKDLSLGPVQADIEAAVCSAFSLHPALVGTRLGVENSGSWADTIASAQNLFYDLFGYPTWARYEKTITRSLLREVDDNTLRFIRFDKSKVRALQADLGKRTAEANAAANYWTVNERRVHTGQRALDDGDERGDEIGNASTSPFEMFGAAAAGKELFAWHSQKPKMPLETKGRVLRGGAKSPTGDARTSLWKAFDRRAIEEERTMESAALAQFKAEKADITKRLESAPKSDASNAFLDGLLARLKTMYGKEGEYHKAWLARYIELIGHTVAVGGRDIAAEVGFDFSLANPRVVEAIAKRANRLAGNVSETTYQMIRDIVTAGREGGLGMSEIAKTIRDEAFGGDITEVRAIRIARTETIGALNHGEHLSAVESGVLVSKEWLSQGDARVRESHELLDGKRIAIDETFDNGLMYPGDQSGDADEVIQCRCTLLYHDTEA